MAVLLTQIQGHKALNHLIHRTPRIAAASVENFRGASFKCVAAVVHQNQSGYSYLSSLYSGLYNQFPTATTFISTQCYSNSYKMSQVGLKLAHYAQHFAQNYVSDRFIAGAKSLESLAKAHPWKISLAITTFKATLADYVTQKYIEKKTSLDYRRLGTFFVFGAIYSGCICHTLYNYVYPFLFPVKNAFGTISMILLDNFVNTPFLFFPTFYFIKAQECSFKFLERYKDEVLESTVESWKLWMPAHFITFGVLPTHMRIPFVTVVSFFYYTLVSLQQTRFEQRLLNEHLKLNVAAE